MKPEPFLLSLQQISEGTGQSLPVVHDAINVGHLVTFLVGRRRFAKPEAVQAWVDHLQDQSNAGKPVCYRARPADRLAVSQ